MKRSYFLYILLGLAVLTAASKRYWWPVVANNVQRKTISDRVKEFGAAAKARLVPHFETAGINYPPARLIFVCIKNQNRLEVYASNNEGPLRFVHSYPILRASGTLGPKLKEGDRQVPEGIYNIELLNPNSSFHVSLRVGYPNQFDREQADKEGRTNLGGDIMIHGGAVSIGCLAMGDEVAEELFVLAAASGKENIEVILTPVDFRREPMPPTAGLAPWTETLYAMIKPRLAALPLSH
jgi:hypothetical protein